MEEKASKLFEKHITQAFDNVFFYDAIKFQKRIEEIRKSIKHPHFYYAVFDEENNTVTYKKKKWYKWFSGKRIVRLKIQPLEVDGLEGYYVQGEKR